MVAATVTTWKANISQIETYITTSQLHVRYWTIYVSNFCYRKNKFKFSFMVFDEKDK